MFREESVHTKTLPRDLAAAIILEPSCAIKNPDAFSLILVYSHTSVLPCLDQRIIMLFCVPGVPIVSSVPKHKTNCPLVTKLYLLVPGAVDITVAGVATPPDKSHLCNAPLFLVANKSSPKISKDQ